MKLPSNVSAVAIASLFAAGCASAPPPVTATPGTTAAKVESTVESKNAPAAAPVEPSQGATAPPLAKVLEQAKAEGTIPVLIFSTVWCQPCETIEKEVLPNSEVVKALGAYRLQKYDAEIGEGLTAAQKFGVSSYPTMIFLSPDGTEAARMLAPQTPDKMVETLKSKQVLAKAGDTKQADANDPQTLLEVARAEEAVAKSDPAKARKLYGAALSAALKQKKPELASEASFALLQLDTRAQDRKEHAAALLAFAKLHATTPKALDALEGLAGLSGDTGVKPLLKLPEIRAIGTKLEASLVMARKDADLRRLSSAQKKLGDEEGASRSEAAAATLGTNKPGAPEMIRFADPLSTKFSFSGVTAKVTAESQFVGATTRQLVEECRQLPHPTDAIMVRVYSKSGAITRAVVLDPELPAELRACLERAATSVKNVPANIPEKSELRVLFAPAKH